jgi:hypothetical protein
VDSPAILCSIFSHNPNINTKLKTAMWWICVISLAYLNPVILTADVKSFQALN